MSDIIRDALKDEPDLLRRYERNEARYILSLPEDYVTMDIDFGIEKEEFVRFVIALAELDLTVDEWAAFKLKELILSERMKGTSDENNH